MNEEIRTEVQRLCLDARSGSSRPTNRRLTLKLKSIPLLEAVNYVSYLAGTQYKVCETGIEIGCQQYEVRLYRLNQAIARTKFQMYGTNAAIPLESLMGARYVGTTHLPLMRDLIGGEVWVLSQRRLLILCAPTSEINKCEAEFSKLQFVKAQ